MLNRKLNVLKNVVESGSFTAAAKKMYTSQPSVSRDIKQLEKEYKIKVFESTKNSLTMTVEGEILYRYAIEAEAMNEHLINDIHEVGESVNGDINIGASHSYGEFVLPSVLVQIHEIYPELHCHVHIGNSQDVIDHLKDKTIDIGIIEIDRHYPGIEKYSLFRDEMVLITHKDTLGSNDSMSDYKCFVREPYSGTRYYQEEVLKGMRIDPERVEMNNTELIKHCVKNKMGFTILSKQVLQNEEKSEINIHPTGVARDFSVVISKGRYMTSKTQAVLDVIKS